MRVLINDFIGGALDRGIPLYVRNLIEGLRDEGLDVRVVRAPAIFRKLPRGVLYLIAVLVEQTLLPAIGFLLRADVTIYPYNSVAVIDLLTRRGRIVVHDLEQLNRPPSFSKLYYLFCYRAVKWFNAPLFTISDITRARLTQSGLFGGGPVTLLPNTFYAFERLPRRRRRGATLRSYCAPARRRTRTSKQSWPNTCRVFWQRAIALPSSELHKAADMAKLQPVAAFMTSGQLQVCGRLSDQEVARAYRAHAVVWVHSLREGFGRCVVEGRLAGAPVLATDIAEFAELLDGDVYLYNNPASFSAELDRLIKRPRLAAPYTGYPYRELLRRAVDSAMRVKEPEAQPNRRKPYEPGEAQRAEHRGGTEILDSANFDVPIARHVIGHFLDRRVQKLDGEHDEQ